MCTVCAQPPLIPLCSFPDGLQETSFDNLWLAGDWVKGVQHGANGLSQASRQWLRHQIDGSAPHGCMQRAVLDNAGDKETPHPCPACRSVLG